MVSKQACTCLVRRQCSGKTISAECNSIQSVQAYRPNSQPKTVRVHVSRNAFGGVGYGAQRSLGPWLLRQGGLGGLGWHHDLHGCWDRSDNLHYLRSRTALCLGTVSRLRDVANPAWKPARCCWGWGLVGSFFLHFVGPLLVNIP